MASRLERKVDARRVRVASRVREALLSDAKQGKLSLLRQWRELVVDTPTDDESRPIRKRRGESAHCRREAEIVQGLGSKLTRDPPYIIKAGSCRLLSVTKILLELGWSALHESAQLQHDRGE